MRKEEKMKISNGVIITAIICSTLIIISIIEKTSFWWAENDKGIIKKL